MLGAPPHLRSRRNFSMHLLACRQTRTRTLLNRSNQGHTPSIACGAVPPLSLARGGGCCRCTAAASAAATLQFNSTPMAPLCAARCCSVSVGKSASRLRLVPLRDVAEWGHACPGCSHMTTTGTVGCFSSFGKPHVVVVAMWWHERRWSRW